MDEETTSTGAADAVDTSNTGNTGSETTEVTDETGGVTQEEINAALGPRYQTAPPVKQEVATDEEEAASDDPSEDEKATESETTTEETTQTKPEVKPALTTETATDEPDFSFTVEDANGVSYKVGPDDKMEDVLADFDPKNNGQLLDVLDKLREAKENQATHYREQSEHQAEADKTERVATIQQGWENEFKQLNIKDDDRKAEIYKYMGEENDKRQAAGRPMIASVEDAKLGLEAREAVAAKELAAKDAKETARKNGSLVGGSSAAASGGSPVYQAGSARNSNQALKALGLL